MNDIFVRTCSELELAHIIAKISTNYWEENVRLLTNGFCFGVCINYEEKTVDYCGTLYKLTDSQFDEIMKVLTDSFNYEKNRVGVDYDKYIAIENMYSEYRFEYLDWE